MNVDVTGVSKGGVQKFNGHLYWFSWQVTTYLLISKPIICAQDNDANVKNAKWDWFNARNYCRYSSNHTDG